MALDAVSTSGATLAALLTSLATAPSDVDGFILGNVRSRTQTTLQDHEEATTAEAREGVITGLPCLAGSFSFYEPSGAIDAERLRELTAAFPEPLLGWFSFRADTRLHLSMREQVLAPAALQALREHRHGSEVPCSPLLFATMSRSAEHGGASTSFQYRFYQNSSPSEPMQPVRLIVRNVGSAHGHHRDFALPAPLGGLPAVPFAADPSPLAASGRESAAGGGEPPGAGSSRAAGRPTEGLRAAGGGAASAAGSSRTDSLRQAAVHAVAGINQQVNTIETLYFELLGEVEKLEAPTAADSAALQERRSTVDGLLAALQ